MLETDLMNNFKKPKYLRISDEINVINMCICDNNYSELLKLKEKLKSYEIGKELISSKILAFSLAENGKVVAACGIRGLLNVLVIHVKEYYRGQGLGSKLLKFIINEARNKGLIFITLTVSSNNLIAIQLYLKYNFKKVTYLKQSNNILMMLPLNSTGFKIFKTFKTLFIFMPNMFQIYIHKFLYKISI